MIDTTELKQFCTEMSTTYPSLKEDINKLYYYCIDEILEGSSQKHEIMDCYNKVIELINN